MAIETCQRLSENAYLAVDAAAAAEFSLEFTPHLLAGSTAVLRACREADAVLVVSGQRPTSADRALWENLDGHRKAGLLRATARVRLSQRDRGFSGVTAVLRAAIAAGLARRDVFVTCGDPHTTQITTMAAAMFRRYTDAVQIVTDLAALAGLLTRGWNATLHSEPVSLPLHRVTALADLDLLLTGAPLSPDEVAALRTLAARLPAIRGVAGQLACTDTAERTVALRRELLDVIRGGWQAALPRRAGTHSRSTAAAGSGHGDAGNPVRITRRLSFPVIVDGGVLDPERSQLTCQLPRGARVLCVVDGYSASAVAGVGSVLRASLRSGRLAGFDVRVLASSPAAKTLSGALSVVGHAERRGLGPDDRIIVMGGGTVMDIVGFAAALYRGATPYIRIPTTLVGLVDAGVGFKVGVDAEGRRNLIGAYHPPVACLCDPGFLGTLPDPELRCGLAEMIKIAAVRDRELFELIESCYGEVLARRPGPAVTRLIRRSIEVMVSELSANPYETELRRLPDFGHEFGHMLETASGLSLRHGEAVAIGMALACQVAVETGRLDPANCGRIIGLIQATGLPVHDTCCDPAALWRGLRDDVVPHKNGSLSLAVPVGIGAGDFIESLSAVNEPMLGRACRQLRLREEDLAQIAGIPGD